MKYLFFDIECANCFNGKGKMIEFGYCLTDENFNILYKDTFVMSPGKEKFDKKIYKRDPSFRFAYEYEYYYDQPLFPVFYKRIKKLLEDKDIMVFGYAVANDIRYLSYTCERYKLDPIKFMAYDGQNMISYYSSKRTKFSGLEHAAKVLCDKNELLKLEPHLSRDDAVMSMMVIKQMCKNLDIDIKELITVCPDCQYDSIKYIEIIKDRKIHPELYMTNKHFKTNDRAVELYEELVNKDKDLLNDENYFGKVITISAFLKIDIDQIKKIIKQIEDKGYLATDTIGESNLMLVADDSDKIRLLSKFKKPYSGKFITLKEFLAL